MRRERKIEKKKKKKKKQRQQRCSEERAVGHGDDDILIMGATKRRGREGIKERRSKKGTLACGSRGRRRRIGCIVAPSFSFLFILSVPDLNSSQIPLQPFGLRLTVRPAVLSFLPSPSRSLHHVIHFLPCPPLAMQIYRRLCLRPEIATRRLSFMRRGRGCE